ncbi:TPA: hypothetical protein ACH3X1_000662 [Trebouxia sp. C0004]
MFRSTNQGHIQFVAQKQDSHLSGQAPDAEPKQVMSRDSHPWQSATLGQPQQQQMPRAQQPPPQGLLQQQAPLFGTQMASLSSLLSPLQLVLSSQFQLAAATSLRSGNPLS